MPFANRNLQMLRNWEPDEHFDPTTDRLLLTSSEDELIVAYWHRSHDRATGHLAVDLDFTSKTFADIPVELRMYHNFHTQEDWCVFLYDGDMTADGPKLDIVAMGQGWRWEMHTSLCLKIIQPVSVDDLRQLQLPEYLSGVYVQAHRADIVSRDSDARNELVGA